MRNIIDSKIKSVEEQLLYSDNQLINWEQIVNQLAVIISFSCMVGGLFGMNVKIPG